MYEGCVGPSVYVIVPPPCTVGKWCPPALPDWLLPLPLLLPPLTNVRLLSWPRMTRKSVTVAVTYTDDMISVIMITGSCATTETAS